MSEKRKIDDAELTEIAGAGELVLEKDGAPSKPGPMPVPVEGDLDTPDTDDQDHGDQNLGT